jgi:hypothetical protein
MCSCWRVFDRFSEVQAPDWKTRAARQVRDAARAQGQIPLLAGQLMKVRLMAAAIQRQVAAFPEPRPLQGGHPERVVIWREGALWCRARVDYLHEDFRTIDDLKTTSESAHPAEWSRRLFDRGADLQVAFHTRGVHVVTGQHPEFRFLVVETEPPHALSLIGLDPEALAFAHTRRQMALERWGRCLRTGDWPGYPRRTLYAELPPWIQTRFLERGYYEDAVSHDAR